MVQSIRKQQLNPGNPASHSLIMAIAQPALLFSKQGQLIAINDKARTALGLNGKKTKNLSLFSLISLCNYEFKLTPKSFSFENGKKLRLAHDNYESFLTIEFVCMETISETNKTNGYILLGAMVENNTAELINKKAHNLSHHHPEFDAIPCGIFIKDLNGVLIDCNITMANMLGFDTIAELCELDCYRLAIKGRASVKRNDQLVIKSKKTLIFEEEVTLQNGKRYCFQTIKAPFFNKKNEIIGIIGTSIDITKKKNNEAILNKKLLALKQESIKSYNYLDRIIASIPGNVWWTDKKNKVLGANNRAVKFLGFKSREELIGLTYEQVGKWKINPKTIRKFYDDDMEVMRTGIAKENIPEPPLIGPRGEKIYYLTTRSPLFDENGKISGIIGTSWDITSRVNMEKKLKSAQKKIEASSRAKDEFLATVSHELRTPLNGILGMADILSRQKLNPKEASMVTDLTKSGTILLSLIDDLLDITKIDLHEIKINSGKLNLEESIREVITHLSLQLGKKSLEVNFTYSQQLPKFINGDIQRIKQILFNLIGNAIKYTDNGYINIDVKGKEAQSNAKILQISITDTGVGIPNDKLSYIFDRFTQVRSDSTKHILGAGLGLSIVKSLIELMGGTISVTSRLNVGSTFVVELPYEPIKNIESTENLTELSQTKILVIDDDISSGENILHKLQPLNAQLVSSLSAIKIIESNHQLNTGFDIIIFNIATVGNLSETLLREINNKFHHLNLAIILCYDTSEIKQKGLTTIPGVTLTIKLPQSNELFLTAIQQAWERSLISAKSSKKMVHDMQPHVLLVEDNLINQKIAVHLLSELNCSVDVSPNGNTAIEWSKKNNYNLVLLDIGLPDIDGTLVSKAIRKIKGHRGKIPIIAMTAYASEKDRERCLTSGINDVITKPVDLNMLRTVMHRWLSDKVT